MPVTALSPRPAQLNAAAALLFDPDHPLLRQARDAVAPQSLPYSANIAPEAAWALFEQQAAVLIDVRTAEERKFVGYVPGSLHLPWLMGTALQTNPRFVRELEAKVPKSAVVLLLCRSGARSVSAASAAVRAGFQHVYNILEGFEGELDDSGHRGQHSGWRFRGLPWIQD
jgi:rhodanese-related sulfurtransferase